MIVMKFGGTSVEDAKAIDRVAAIVKGRLAQKPVVVVSAMAKVTDQLLAMARAAGAGDRKTALKLCRALAGAPLQHRRRVAGHGAVHRTFTATWAPTSRRSTNCCAASPPSAS